MAKNKTAPSMRATRSAEELNRLLQQLLTTAERQEGSATLNAIGEKLAKAAPQKNGCTKETYDAEIEEIAGERYTGLSVQALQNILQQKRNLTNKTEEIQKDIKKIQRVAELTALKAQQDELVAQAAQKIKAAIGVEEDNDQYTINTVKLARLEKKQTRSEASKEDKLAALNQAIGAAVKKDALDSKQLKELIKDRVANIDNPETLTQFKRRLRDGIGTAKKAFKAITAAAGRGAGVVKQATGHDVDRLIALALAEEWYESKVRPVMQTKDSAIAFYNTLIASKGIAPQGKTAYQKTVKQIGQMTDEQYATAVLLGRNTEIAQMAATIAANMTEQQRAQGHVLATKAARGELASTARSHKWLAALLSLGAGGVVTGIAAAAAEAAMTAAEHSTEAFTAMLESLTPEDMANLSAVLDSATHPHLAGDHLAEAAVTAKTEILQAAGQNVGDATLEVTMPEVTADTTPPIELTLSNHNFVGADANKPVTVTIAVDGGAPITLYQNKPFSVVFGADNKLTINPTGQDQATLGLGSHTVAVTVKDQEGAVVAEQAEVEVTVNPPTLAPDTTAPQVAFGPVPTLNTTDNTYPVTFTLSDPAGPGQVAGDANPDLTKIVVGGKEYPTLTTNGNTVTATASDGSTITLTKSGNGYTANIPQSDMPAGQPTTIKVTAVDDAGNSQETPHDYTIAVPGPDYTIESGTLSLTGLDGGATATKPATVDLALQLSQVPSSDQPVTLVIKDNGVEILRQGNVTLPANTPNPSVSLDWPSTYPTDGTADGAHNVTVEMLDANNQTIPATIPPTSFVLDTLGPQNTAVDPITVDITPGNTDAVTLTGQLGQDVSPPIAGTLTVGTTTFAVGDSAHPLTINSDGTWQANVPRDVFSSTNGTGGTTVNTMTFTATDRLGNATTIPHQDIIKNISFASSDRSVALAGYHVPSETDPLVAASTMPAVNDGTPNLVFKVTLPASQQPTADSTLSFSFTKDGDTQPTGTIAIAGTDIASRINADGNVVLTQADYQAAGIDLKVPGEDPLYTVKAELDMNGPGVTGESNNPEVSTSIALRIDDKAPTVTPVEVPQPDPTAPGQDPADVTVQATVTDSGGVKSLTAKVLDNNDNPVKDADGNDKTYTVTTPDADNPNRYSVVIPGQDYDDISSDDNQKLVLVAEDKAAGQGNVSDPQEMNLPKRTTSREVPAEPDPTQGAPKVDGDDNKALAVGLGVGVPVTALVGAGGLIAYLMLREPKRVQQDQEMQAMGGGG